MEVVGLLVLAVFFGGAVTAVVLAYRQALADKDARRVAEVRAAEVAGELRVTEAALETTELRRLAEKDRADALEEELADADRAAIAHPDPGARRRVLSRWRDANARTAAAGAGDGPASVPDPAPTEAAGRVDRSD
jgi:hypothetical protein